MENVLAPFDQLKYFTPRMNVDHWSRRLQAPKMRREFACKLQKMLTPEVTKHLPPYLQIDGSFEQAEQAMCDLEAKSEVACIVDRASRKVAGLLVVGRDPDEANTVYVGYLLSQTYWGRGLASEMLRGLVDWTEAQGWQGRMLGGVDPGNPASAAVLRKVGFSKDAARSGPDTDMFGRDFGVPASAK